MLFEHLLSPGDRVVVEQPTYDRTLLLLQRLEAELVPVPLEADGIDVGALEAALAEGPIKLAHVIPNFHNPAGCTLSAAKRARLVELAAEHDFWIFEDDPYRELSLRGRAAGDDALARQGRPVVHASSFSKTVSPGVRVGYLAGPAEEIAKLAKRANETYISPNMLAESIVLELCRSGGLDRNIEFVKGALRARCDALVAALREQIPEAEFVVPEGGYFLWLDLAEGTDTAALLAEAKARGRHLRRRPRLHDRGRREQPAPLLRAGPRRTRSPRASPASRGRSTDPRRRAAGLAAVAVRGEHQLLGERRRAAAAPGRRGPRRSRRRCGRRRGAPSAEAIDDLVVVGALELALEARVEPGALEVVEELLGLVLEAQHVTVGAGLDVGEQRRRARGRPRRSGGRGAGRRVADRGAHPLLEHRRHRVLDALGLLVHLVPGDAEDVGEEALDQPVAADDRPRPLAARLGEARATCRRRARRSRRRSRRPIISWTVGGESCIARAMLAPVIGSPASSSQNMISRYSSSATVASAGIDLGRD